MIRHGFYTNQSENNLKPIKKNQKYLYERKTIDNELERIH